MNLEKITELITDCVEILKFTEDDMRKTVIVEDFTEYIKSLNIEDQKLMIHQLLEKLEYEDSNYVIRNLLNCFQGTDDVLLINSRKMIKFKNKRLIKALVEYSLVNNTDNDILNVYLKKPELELQNYIIKLLGARKIRKYNRFLLKILNITIIILYKVLEIRTNENFQSVCEDLLSIIEKNHSFIPETDKIKTSVLNFINLEISNQYNALVDLKLKIIKITTTKIGLIIETFLKSESSILISKLKIISEIIIERINTNINPLSEQKAREILIHLISICFQSIGHFGALPEIRFLYIQFLQNSNNTDVASASINALSHVRKFEQTVCEILQKISSDDKFFLDGVSSMIKINPHLAENYIIDQIKSDNPRKIILGSYFIPHLNNKELDNLTVDLLKFKQPMIIRQALRIISKKKLTSALPSVINFLFSENNEIKSDAITTLMHLNGEGLDFLEKRVNYYSGERKEMLYDIIDSMKEH